MRPAQASGFDWDTENEAHLARHGVSPSEVVQVLLNGPVWLPNKQHRAGAWKIIGWTDGGRALTIIIRVNTATETLRAVTGWDATAADATRYLQRRRDRL
jgi:uncharacterized DUF497 family protein